jgi:Na+/melibiose symporter-like transporter
VLAAFGLFAVVEYGAWFAVILYAYDTGGASLAGIAGVVQLLPAAVLAPALASLGDRLPRSTALVGSYATEAVLLGLTAVLLRQGAPTAMVLLSSALATTSVSVARPIHFATLPQVATTPMALVSANSASGVLDGVGLLVGPVLAGVLTQAEAPWLVLALSALAMVVAAILCIPLRLPAPTAEAQGAVRDAVEGVRAVAGDRPVLVLLLTLGVSFLVVGGLEIVVVAYADVTLGGGGSEAGVLAGAVGVGGLVGSAATAGLAVRTRLAASVTAGHLLSGLALAATAFLAALGPAVIMLALCGLGQAVANVAGRTLLQRGTDGAVLARVFAVQEGVMLLGLAAGAALAPLLVEGLGASEAFLPLAAALVAAAAVVWPAVAALDRRSTVRADVVDLMRRVGFLAAMDPPSIERLSRDAEWVEVDTGTTVIAQGGHGDAFYVVDSGSLAVQVDGRRRDGALSAGDGFGEIALLEDVPRTATVVALEPARLLRIDRDEFLAAVTGSVDGRRIAEEVAGAHRERDAHHG